MVMEPRSKPWRWQLLKSGAPAGLERMYLQPIGYSGNRKYYSRTHWRRILAARCYHGLQRAGSRQLGVIAELDHSMAFNMSQQGQSLPKQSSNRVNRVTQRNTFQPVDRFLPFLISIPEYIHRFVPCA